ncbi:hypothetical protein BH10CYA1_BH10CYA1_36210 [soil metagenome]
MLFAPRVKFERYKEHTWARIAPYLARRVLHLRVGSVPTPGDCQGHTDELGHYRTN